MKEFRDENINSYFLTYIVSIFNVRTIKEKKEKKKFKMRMGIRSSNPHPNLSLLFIFHYLGFFCEHVL